MVVNGRGQSAAPDHRTTSVDHSEQLMPGKRHVLIGAAAVVAALVVLAGSTVNPAAAADWTRYRPTYQEQVRGCGEITGKYRLTFALTCTTADGDQRAERRYESYSGGVHRFAGTFVITSLPGRRISLKQTYNEDEGPYFLLAVSRKGKLYDVETKKTLATGVTVGQPVRVRTVHDVGSTLKIYIDGKLVETLDSPSGTFYDKLGAYRTASGSGKVTVRWKKLSFSYR